MSQPWGKFVPFRALLMDRPHEAIAIVLLRLCDMYRMAEQDLQHLHPPRYLFQDIVTEINSAVNTLLGCIHIEYVNLGPYYTAVLEELDRADYSLEYMTNSKRPGQAVFFVKFKNKVLVSDKITLPPHLVHQ